MTDMLSADQIAELVAAARDGNISEEPKASTGKSRRRVRDIDFTRPTKFTKEQERRIERAHEGFCRTASLRMSGELRTEIELEVLNVAQVTLSAAVNSLPPGVIWAVTTLEEQETPIGLAMELPGVMSLIERLLGGAPGPPVTERELSDIERTMARRMFSGIVDDLSVIWDELLGVRLRLDGIESQGSMIQLGPPSEPSISLTMEIRDSDRSSTMSLIVPYRSIESVVDRLPSGHIDLMGLVDVDERATLLISGQLAQTEADIRVEVSSVELPIERLLRLREGDTVVLGTKAASGVVVRTADVPLYRARPGRRGRRLAVEIADQIKDPA
jgi:flagellar motor switch protein FliM